MDLAGRAERELRGNILPFWQSKTPDRERGGFYGEIGDDLVVNKEAARGALLTCRILWTFSAAYRIYGDTTHKEIARWAYDDLVGRFWDKEHGGLFWTVAADGVPLDTSRQIYGQVFGVYALSEYFRATSEPAALERAVALYRLIEKHARDRKNGGYFEVFGRDWKRLGGERSFVNPGSSKSQNTHLHVMEAYTALLRVWPDTELRQTQRELVEIMLTRILDGKARHLRLFLDDTWSPRSDAVSYGHDIEAAWLLTEAAEVLGDAGLLAETRRLAVEIAGVTLAEGVDRDGGVFNEGGPGGATDASKDWWPQTEAAVGFLNAYQISGDERFLAAARKSWEFIETHLVDRERGEWFHSVTREGVVRRRPKVSLWKCPYHNGRGCMEVAERLKGLAAAMKDASL